MTYRTDKFIVGDRVAWSEDETYHMFKDEHGEGPFSIQHITDIAFVPAETEPEYVMGYGEITPQSNWDSMGHTQIVVVKTQMGMNRFSGAWFQKLD